MCAQTRTPRSAIIAALLGLASCGEVRAPDVATNVAANVATSRRRVERRHVVAAASIRTTRVAPQASDATGIDSPAAVARLRDAGSDEIVAMLATTAGRLRRDATYELVRRGPPAAALETLLALLHDDDAGTAAAHALASLGDRALDAVRSRLTALEAAGDAGDEEGANDDLRSDLEIAIEEIEWLLDREPEPDVREPVSQGPPPYVPDIESLAADLRDDSPWTRLAAAAAAGRLGDAARVLRRGIAGALAQGDAVGPAQIAAAAAAGRLGDAARVLRHEIAGVLAQDDAVGLAQIAQALRSLGAEHEALLVIRARMARARHDELRNCMEALGALGDIARDDVAVWAPVLLAAGCRAGRATALRALRRTGGDPVAFRAAVVAALREGDRDRLAAAALVAAHPDFARELRAELVAALPESGRYEHRAVAAALIVAGGLPAADAARLLEDVEPFEVSDVLDAVGRDTARAGDDMALRLWSIVLSDESRSNASSAFRALKRANAIDRRDIPRLLMSVEKRGIGRFVLADLCRDSTAALPRLLQLLEEGHEVAWPLTMMGPRAKAALPRLVLEARDQDFYASFAVGAIGAAGVEPLRRALDGQHAVLSTSVIGDVLGGVRETSQWRTDTHVDAACRGYLALLVGVAPGELEPWLPQLSVHEDPDVRWAAARLSP